PQEILTDNGSQYVTWRGTSAFTKELHKRGIRQVVASPRHPQTLGKIERFWGSLWRECLETAVFVDLAEGRRRVGHYGGHYKFRRPHQGIDGLVRADRYFDAAQEVRQALEARVQANALALAREGLPRPPFYVAGQVGGQGFSLHAEGERVILTDASGQRQDVELGRPAAAAPPAVPEPVGPAVLVAGDAVADAGGEPVAGPGGAPPGPGPLGGTAVCCPRKEVCHERDGDRQRRGGQPPASWDAGSQGRARGGAGGGVCAGGAGRRPHAGGSGRRAERVAATVLPVGAACPARV